MALTGLLRAALTILYTFVGHYRSVKPARFTDMTEFSAILAQLEASDRRLDKPRDVRFAAFKIAIDSPGAAARGAQINKSRVECVTGAYGQVPSERQANTAGGPRGSGCDIEPTPTADLESLLKELRLASGSIAKLQSVRRKLAWACHPDRRRSGSGGRAENLMAEFNAQIDAAIAKLARQSAARKRS